MSKKVYSVSQKQIDIEIGKQLKLRRVGLGKTLDEIGKAVGVSFQQIQKYERGTNSVSCYRLLCLAHALDMSVSQFFEGVSSTLKHATESAIAHIDAHDKELIMLVKYFSTVEDAAVKKKVVELVKSLVG